MPRCQIVPSDLAAAGSCFGRWALTSWPTAYASSIRSTVCCGVETGPRSFALLTSGCGFLLTLESNFHGFRSWCWALLWTYSAGAKRHYSVWGVCWQALLAEGLPQVASKKWNSIVQLSWIVERPGHSIQLALALSHFDVAFYFSLLAFASVAQSHSVADSVCWDFKCHSSVFS